MFWVPPGHRRAPRDAVRRFESLPEPLWTNYFLSLAAFWVFSVPSVLSLQGLHLDAAFILPIPLNIY